ncbi:SGNH/GDSL hydrolase family protein [Cytobacillus purgationiresistens]|uniref:Lysophospholipase L1-like esterase n=1 Tax=Cytobacillus purgationiresistens TaxID=863449 RepID=A0ABU0AE61_9BACI|nr:SGNH/GDSL hydrolase family protein [Cytobacillus purgationiresistens]MDQ0269164.1 lysophospholipase L1-like esterase [Cytobacillus purgationiresistens]
MKKIIFASLIIVIISLTGLIYWNNERATGFDVWDEENITEGEKIEKEKIESITPKEGNEITLKDYLHYKVLTEDKARVAVIGSSVARGKGASQPMFSWFNQLEKQIKSENVTIANDLSFSNYAKSGYTLNRLLDEGNVDEMINDNPDLIIIETSVVNSYDENIKMEDTISAINQTISKVKKELPDSQFILISPNPCSVDQKGEVENALGYTYQDYREETKSYIESKGWKYVDVYKGMEDKIQANDLELNDTLDDGVHPNDLGYRLWFEVMDEYFNKQQEW